MAKDNNPNPSKFKISPWLIYTAILLVFLFISFATGGSNLSEPAQLTSSKFNTLLEKGQIEKVIVYNKAEAEVYLNAAALKDAANKKVAKDIFDRPNKGPHYTLEIGNDQIFQTKLEKAVGEGKLKDFNFLQKNNWSDILISLLPIIIIIGVWIFIMRKMSGGAGGGGGQIFNIGKSKAKLFDEKTDIKTTFKDVAGLEGAKEEIQEIVEFLKNPEKYTNLGGKIPKGALLVGPPGTGKTLLAKAVAGEAQVPFFSLSGSDFVEMFVGVGASRVRDLFKQAKEKSPAIIFIDEIDAVGRARGKSNMSGGNDERENTLNQLLTEMDGFGTNSNVIVLAATNRADVLDKALMRAGRFDRQIFVDLPDIRERAEIFAVHLAPIKKVEGLDLDFLAKQTPGFSGADLANIVNESALLAARKNKRIVTMSDLEEAKDKVMMGAERRSMVMNEEEKTLTAYHEGGHAVVALYEQTSDPIHKATIIPRGRALGMVMRLPERDQLSVTREKMFGDISVAMGGRIAEEMIFGYDKVTSGASSDIEMVTKMAKNMVTRYGMSDQLGPIAYQENEEEVFLGRSVSRTQNVSEETAKKIDAEVKKIVESGYARAKKILADKVDDLHKVAKALLTYETLSGEEIKKIVFENIYPKRLSGKEEFSTTKKKLGSALGAIGLKPNPQS